MMNRNGHTYPGMGLRNRPASDGRLVVALDVGTTKVSCFIAEIDDDGGIHVRGTGYRVSPGVRAGAVVDMEETEAAIRAAVHQAENLAHETVERVIVNLSAGRPKTQIIELDADIDGVQITEPDVQRLLAEAVGKIDDQDCEIVHAFPACYSIDGAIGVRDPVGMFGDRLSVALHAVTCAPGPMRNLLACVENAHLMPESVVLSPYASALATLVDDERELGTACIDIGGGATSVAVFARKAMVHTHVVPIGSHAITEDLARELLTSIDNAERIKILYGSALSSPSDSHENIKVTRLGEEGAERDATTSIPRSIVNSIIQARAAEILDAVRIRLRDSGFDRVSGRRVVLTGGGSQLDGLADLAQEILGKEVRIGRPTGVQGLPEAARGPGFSTCAGLLCFAVKAPMEVGEVAAGGAIHVAETSGVSRVGQVGRWLRENL